ncbi:hypothetical protein IIY66_02405 [Candidatus Saccharibacteria bacterium]|nr:hypothetical protein [Candidatus Saccharibacteria bacterium]
MLKEITGKKVKAGIKNGMGVQAFCKKYSCPPEDLWARIGQLFTVRGAAQRVWRDLKANDKNNAKIHKSKQTRDVVFQANKEPDNAASDAVSKAESCETATVAEPNEVKYDAPPQSETESGSEVASDGAEQAPSDQLQQLTISELEEKERILSSEAIALKRKYDAFKRTRNANKIEAQKILKQIMELCKARDEAWEKIRSMAKEDAYIADQMEGIWAARACKEESLKAIRAQISERNKIAICIYNSGEIALLEEMDTIHLDDTGHEALYEELRNTDEAEDFRPKDLRIVAKVMRVVGAITQRETKYKVTIDLLFDNPEVERAYKVFSN